MSLFFSIIIMWPLANNAAVAEIDVVRKLDESIVEFFNKNGAKGDYIYLGDRGIVGNGHMMMMEKNSDALAALVLSWIEQG